MKKRQQKFLFAPFNALYLLTFGTRMANAKQFYFQCPTHLIQGSGLLTLEPYILMMYGIFMQFALTLFLRIWSL